MGSVRARDNGVAHLRDTLGKREGIGSNVSQLVRQTHVTRQKTGYQGQGVSVQGQVAVGIDFLIGEIWKFLKSPPNYYKFGYIADTCWHEYERMGVRDAIFKLQNLLHHHHDQTADVGTVGRH